MVTYNLVMKNAQTQQNRLHVYLCKLANSVGKVDNVARQQQIDHCNNLQVKLEKYTSWQLLNYAMQRFCKKSARQMQVFQNDVGKWVCDGCYFSISHNNGIVAVAIGDDKVGVDLQKQELWRFDQLLFDRIAHQNEWDFVQNVANQQSQPSKDDKNVAENFQTEEQFHKYVLSLWCKKEALFKQGNNAKFVPNQIDTTQSNFVQYQLNFDNQPFLLEVATNCANAQVFTVETDDVCTLEQV